MAPHAPVVDQRDQQALVAHEVFTVKEKHTEKQHDSAKSSRAGAKIKDAAKTVKKPIIKKGRATSRWSMTSERGQAVAKPAQPDRA